jgi:multiple sugar transport system permease protein
MEGFRKNMYWKAAIAICNLLAILFLLLPIVAIFFGAVQTEKQLISDVRNPLPKGFTLKNFQVILTGKGAEGGIAHYLPPNVGVLPKAFLNSTIVSLSVTFLCLTFASMSAYAISRLKQRWTRAFLYISLATRLVPLMTLMVPLYVSLRGLHLLNSLTGIVVTEVGFLLPYAIWILTGFFGTLPRDLEDAARIDGCSRVQAFLQIILPLSAPGIASCGVIMFILSWNELVVPLIISTRPEVMTIPVLLASLVSDKFLFFTLMMAICLIALTPSVLLALLLRKYVVKGLISGALKG